MTKKLKDISILNVICCTLVVLIHLTSAGVTSLNRPSLPFNLFFIMNKAATFVVPAFVFLSGFKLTNSYRSKDFVYMDFLKTRFMKIFIPYVGWFIFYYLYFLKIGYIEPTSFIGLLKIFIFGELVSPFYFITLIFQFYFLFGLLKFLDEKYKVYFIVIITILNLLVLNGEFMYSDRFFLSYIIYFVLGMELAQNKNKIDVLLQRGKFFVSPICLGIIFVYLYKLYFVMISGSFLPHYKYWELVFCLSSIVFFYSLCQFISNTKNKGFNTCILYVDRASFYIFLSHCFFLYFFERIWYRFGIISIVDKFILNAVFVYFSSYFISIFYVFLKSKWKKRNIKIVN